MEQKLKKCSLIDHKENEAISFCQECKIYMCKKCEKLHSELFKYHHAYEINKEKNEIEVFIGLCQELNHFNELDYFCKTHNKLCCAKCITRIKTEENGQHTDCNLCLIKDIENEKKNKLKNNIKCLEDLNNALEQSINKLKESFKKIDKDKENLKINIQKIFTKLRNAINDREDELLLDIDKKYNSLFFNEDFMKESEKLPNKIKMYLEKGKLIDEQWNNNNLKSLINDCLNIENSINYINNINEKLKKCNSLDFEIKFSPTEDEFNKYLEELKKFGKIYEYKNKLFDSKIEFDQELIKSWLNNKDFTSQLLFRKTRDGSKTKDLHDKCDNKGITIVFIETTKGYKFGGYTELEWDNKSGSKKDKSTFLFSLNKREKYLPRNDNGTMYCHSECCPWFGSSGYPEIFLDYSLDKGISYDNSTKNTFFNGRKLTNGDTNWDVKELEIYKIIYI